jgi:hypothetical protein
MFAQLAKVPSDIVALERRHAAAVARPFARRPRVRATLADPHVEPPSGPSRLDRGRPRSGIDGIESCGADV